MPHVRCHRPRKRAIQYSRALGDRIEKPRRTGYPAFAGYDGIGGCARRLEGRGRRNAKRPCPTGKSSHLLDFSSPVALQKYFRSSPTQITSLVAPSRSSKGRLAIVTNAGRDAMDADCAFDEQHVKRTAKSCGSDAPMLASSFAVNARRRWQQSPVTGKSAKETVKTIARGMPGETGVTVVTMLVCFFIFACEAAGASSARHSLRPHLVLGRKIHASLGRFAPRERNWLFETWIENPPLSCRTSRRVARTRAR
jgi:hypothetical protein